MRKPLLLRQGYNNSATMVKTRNYYKKRLITKAMAGSMVVTTTVPTTTTASFDLMPNAVNTPSSSMTRITPSATAFKITSGGEGEATGSCCVLVALSSN